jgi:DNA-binding MarR family transcriptional regulator
MEIGSTTKTNLIHKNIHDIPSGTEIIKRLIRKGWVNEIPDETDKRKVQVSINEAGKGALVGSFKEIEKVSKIISANLEPAEKEQLLRILKKLDAFHWPIFENRKGKSLEELVEL